MIDLPPRFLNLHEAKAWHEEHARALGSDNIVDRLRRRFGYLARWRLKPAYYWLAAGVLLLTEVPLLYKMFDSLSAPSGSEGFHLNLEPALLAVAFAAVVMITVKAAGVLLRMATLTKDEHTLAQLESDDDPSDLAEAFSEESSEPRRMGSRIATVRSYQVLAVVLIVLLLVFATALAWFRTDVFRQLVDSNAAAGTSFGEGLGATGDSASGVVTELDPVIVFIVFEVALLLSVTVGTTLAWLSFDPDRYGLRKDVLDLLKVRDRSRASRADIEVRLVTLEQGLETFKELEPQLTRYALAQERRRLMTYWKHNLHVRPNRMTMDEQSFINSMISQAIRPPQIIDLTVHTDSTASKE